MSTELSGLSSQISELSKQTTAQLGSLDNSLAGLRRHVGEEISATKKDIYKLNQRMDDLLTNGTKNADGQQMQRIVEANMAARKALEDLKAERLRLESEKQAAGAAPTPDFLAFKRQMREETKVQQNRACGNKAVVIGWTAEVPDDVRKKEVEAFHESQPEHLRPIDHHSPYTKAGVISGVSELTYRTVTARQNMNRRTGDRANPWKIKFQGKDVTLYSRAQFGAITTAENRMIIEAAKSIEKEIRDRSGLTAEHARKAVSINFPEGSIAYKIVSRNDDGGLVWHDEGFKASAAAKKDEEKGKGSNTNNTGGSASSSAAPSRK